MRCSALRCPITGSTAARRLNSRLICGVRRRFAFNLWCEATLLAGGVDLEPVTGRRIVASISGIGESPLDGVADHVLHGRNDGAERMVVVGIAGERRHMGDELAAA